MRRFRSTLFFALILTALHYTKSHSSDHLEIADVLGEENVADQSHLKHHIKEQINAKIDVENMTEHERDWYYFRLHDTDADFRLDGLELLKAWQHHYMEHAGHEDSPLKGMNEQEMKRYIEEQNALFVELIDAVLKEYDGSRDGYLDYFEYMTARMKQREPPKKEESSTQSQTAGNV